MINFMNMKRTYNLLCVLLLRRVNKLCKQSILWKDSTMPEIYQEFLFEVSTSVPRNLGLKFKFSVFWSNFGQYLILVNSSECWSKLKINDSNELRKTRAFRWCANYFTFMFGSTRVPLGLNKLWLPGQERKKSQG